MAFVNESIAGSAGEKYGLPEFKRHIGQYSAPTTCTVDHARGLWLMEVAAERDGEQRPTGLTGWFFCWRGNLLWIETRVAEIDGGPDGPVRMRRRVTGLDVVGEKTLRLDREQYLPPELERQWKEILTDLHDALLAHGENGLSLGGAAFGPELEVAEDVLSRPEGMQAWMFRRDEGRADTLIEPVDYGPYDIFGAYPYKRRPELTPERVARRFLALADSLKSPDDFSEARVLETTRLPMERSGTGNGRFVIYLPDSDWYCFFFYVDDNRFEPGATYKFVHGTRARGETEVFADMAPVCRMCFDAYVSSLLRMGFETDEFQDRDQIGRILSYYYGRNGVGVEIVPNLDGFWPEDKRNCTCVRSIVIRVGASRKKDVRA